MTWSRPTRRTLLAALGTGVAASLAACSDSGSAVPAGGSTPTTLTPAPGASTSSGSTSSGSTSSGSTSSGSTSGTAAAGSQPGAGGGAGAAPHAAGPDITHGPSIRNAVALTFHGAGDVAILRNMLAEFKDAGSKITVLAIGQWLAAAPEVAGLVLDGGHELGNHTWSHQTMPRLAPAQVRTEIARAAAQLRQQTGGPGSWFRPSGTPHSTATIRTAAVAAGYGACLQYDVDPLDYTDPGPDAVVRNFTAGVKAGSIVSLHLGHPGTLAAMPRLLSHLHDHGLAAVTASDLLGIR